MTKWLKGTVNGRATYVRDDYLPRGRSLFVTRENGVWRAYSSKRDYLDTEGTGATAAEAAWCDKVVFIASGGAGAAYFDV